MPRLTRKYITPSPVPVVPPYLVVVKFTEDDAYNRTVDQLKEYHYLTDLALHPGDYAVVQAQGHLKVVRVQRTIVASSLGGGELKWILDKVDLSMAKAREQRLETQAQADRILREAQARLSQQALLDALLPTLNPEQAAIVASAYGLLPPQSLAPASKPRRKPGPKPGSKRAVKQSPRRRS